jgi:hypothetical protein
MPVTGMTNWLKRNNFTYSKPHGVPVKANPVTTKIIHGWIKRKSDKTIETTGQERA